MTTAFIVSDPHGYFDPLHSIVEFAKKVYQPDHFIFLGDYVDNGMQSYEVLNYLYALDKSSGNVHVLAGNHEQSLVYNISHWHLFHCRNYLTMSDTMKSFAHSSEFISWEEAEKIIYSHESLFQWVKDLPTILSLDSFEPGGTIFTHAGVNPNNFKDKYYHTHLHPLFFSNYRTLPYTFMMGHISVKNFSDRIYPLVSKNLIMTDTNAYRYGKMFGLLYDLDSCKILETIQKEVDK